MYPFCLPCVASWTKNLCILGKAEKKLSISFVASFIEICSCEDSFDGPIPYANSITPDFPGDWTIPLCLVS